MKPRSRSTISKQAVKTKPPESKAVRFRILPVTLTLLGLMMLQKTTEVYTGFRAIASATAAEEKEADKAEAKNEEDASAEEHKDSDEDHGGGDDGHGGKSIKPKEEPVTEGTGKTTIKKIEEVKEKQQREDLTPTEMDILQSLKKRRLALDEREKELEVKLKVLDVAEERINARMNEMRELQQELKRVLNNYEDKQDSEIRGLVKIYENMKPADAATIFNEMDMPILLAVIDKMSERKVAPVLAAMLPTKARDVTEELAEMRKLQRLKTERANKLTQ